MTASTHRKRETWDRLVNDRFAGEQPVLTAEESLVAAKRLFRQAMGRPFVGEVRLASGNRYTWVRRGVLYVNPDKPERQFRGLRALIHDISHYAHRRLNPGEPPHSKNQARLEARLVTYALKSGFLTGALLPRRPATQVKPTQPSKPDRVMVRYARMCERRNNWAAALERATRLLAKAEREIRAYERRHGQRLASHTELDSRPA